MEGALTWMVGFPFLGALLLGISALVPRRAVRKSAGGFASLTAGLSFLEATRVAKAVLGPGGAPVTAALAEWLSLPGLRVSWTLRADALTAVMALVVSGVGFLIHVYSIGYMAGDESQPRFFSLLNLFSGFMLLLVTASSLPIMFVGWEGVGLCSYLLIGFWFTRRVNAAAGKKAFIVNRLGDAGLLLGMFLLYRTFGTLEIASIVQHPLLGETAETATLELICLLLFVGCVGKSAQFPLHVWLPDAMAGPTPVSALIHAATMVTAGVYLIARLSFLYAAAPIASELVAYTGAFTALFAATVGLVQTDIKKVLAFSTVSQLGFMVLGMGVGAYGEGIYHLVTHAFFKALLFLAAGSVIHALHGEQDILRMGGLRTYLVNTILVFAAGALAITGVPLTSGWFSKDAILYRALAQGRLLLFGTGIAAAMVTAVYMARLFYFVFLGVPRSSARELRDVHESPAVMLAPMWVLAALSIFGGAFGVTDALRGVLAGPAPEPAAPALTEAQFGLLLGMAALVAAAGTLKFHSSRGVREAVSPVAVQLRALLLRQYRTDDLAVWLGTALTRALSCGLRAVDLHLVDRPLDGLAAFTREVGSFFARLQNGLVQAYALAMGVGALFVVWLLLRAGAG